MKRATLFILVSPRIYRSVLPTCIQFSNCTLEVRAIKSPRLSIRKRQGKEHIYLKNYCARTVCRASLVPHLEQSWTLYTVVLKERMKRNSFHSWKYYSQI